MADLIFPVPTLLQAESGVRELYKAFTTGGVPVAHIANDICGVCTYAASVALPDDHVKATGSSDPKGDFVRLVKPYIDPEGKTASAEKIPWAQLMQLLLQLLPLFLKDQ